jgi:integrase
MNATTTPTPVVCGALVRPLRAKVIAAYFSALPAIDRLREMLRHCCATDILNAGGNVRDVQSLLGQASLETTMIYVHGDGERVRSPLDAMTVPINVIPFQQAA